MLRLKSVSYQKHISQCSKFCGRSDIRIVAKYNPRSHRCECSESQAEHLVFVDDPTDPLFVYESLLGAHSGWVMLVSWLKFVSDKISVTSEEPGSFGQLFSALNTVAFNKSSKLEQTFHAKQDVLKTSHQRKELIRFTIYKLISNDVSIPPKVICFAASPQTAKNRPYQERVELATRTLICNSGKPTMPASSLELYNGNWMMSLSPMVVKKRLS